MRYRLSAFLALLCLSVIIHAQAAPEMHESTGTEHYQLYAGYAYQSNTFNGVPGHRQSLNGWEASLAFPHLWRGLRFKMDTTQYRGNNYGAPQNAYYILGGWQYDQKIGHETLYGEVLAGDIGINQNWGPNASPGMTASFTTVMGGGLDTPISRRFAIRVGGDWVYENYALIVATTNTTPYRVAGLPNFFGKVNAGVVWKF
jgi:hypothetical protein